MTTATNTGAINGTCHLIEQQLNRKLLHLPCRHHVYELQVAKVWSTLMTTSSGSDIPILKRFSTQWTSIDQTKYTCLPQDDIIDREDLVTFAQHQLRVDQPRDDYAELLELWIIIMGGKPEGRERKF